MCMEKEQMSFTVTQSVQSFQLLSARYLEANSQTMMPFPIRLGRSADSSDKRRPAPSMVYSPFTTRRLQMWWRSLRKEPAMRACMLFVTGLLVGLGLHTVAAQSENRGLVQMNHVGINVPNLDEAVTYYTKTLGFPEAFRVNDDKGQARLVYVQVSKNTFFELQPGPGRPAAINHVGIHVENMAAATAMFKQRGANVGEIRNSDTKAVLNNITDPNGIRIELAELGPQSMHRQAMDRWK
jgi:catechol 2,3-dioxygenase-like lactoylglutathione lyase family enzyme